MNYPHTDSEIQAFRSALLSWFAQYGRDLPWRHTKDPYIIWVSEVILQQTQIVQGIDYFHRITERFPDVASLAAAPVEELLLLWQGLGYYSRAHNMHHAAKQVMSDFEGVFPREAREVASLKGVGPYTTAAIMSIAYDEPMAVVDGNVYRVLSRLTASPVPIDTGKGQRHYWELAQAYISPTDPSHYNQGIMDLGAMICTPLSPKCDACPVAPYCKSRGNEELIGMLPIKEKKVKVTPLYMDYFLVLVGSDFYTEQRDQKGIWKGLYQFPLIESTTSHLSDLQLQQHITERGWRLTETIELPPHRLTHRLVSIRVHVCHADRKGDPADAYQLNPIDQHRELAFPRPLRTFLNTYFKAKPAHH
ncbi:MAG: A/G-specific adenine glycosylase [Porphyromonas sp.]|nr:A/G-specific adenine glycosylase [Porphyromonas sp.]